MIQLPGQDYYLSEFSTALGQILAPHGVFNHYGVPMIWRRTNRLEDEQLVRVDPQMLRGFIERYSLPYASSTHGTSTEIRRYNRTLSTDYANATLADPHFLDQLLPLKAVNLVPLPIRHAGTIKMLRPGYDPSTGILTDPKASASPTLGMNFEDAKIFLRELLGEVCFQHNDRERGICIVLAAMLTFFCRHLLEGTALRPGFLYSANAEGAGKTTLALLALIPFLGYAPTGYAPQKDEEMAKLILAALLDAKSVLFLDNVKGHISFASLEALMTATKYSGRVLGLSKIATLPNTLTVIITANGATYSPDLRRRLCAVELFLPEARCEDHLFRRPLDVETIMAKQPQILVALGSLVDAYAKAGEQPAPLSYGGMTSYNAWSRTILPILHHAGFGPFQAAGEEMKVSGDRQTIDMEKLVNLMQPGADYDFGGVIQLCGEHALFDWILGTATDVFEGVEPRIRSKFGKLLKGYGNRSFRCGKLFCLTGTDKDRAYAVRKI